MAGDPLMAVTAPTTHAAPKLGRSMRGIVPLSARAGKSLSRNLLSMAGAAHSASFLPSGIFWRPFVAVLAMGARFTGLAGIADRYRKLFHIDASLGAQRFFDCLAYDNPLVERVPMDAANSAPLGERARLAIGGEIATDAAVVGLHDARSPAAVARLIVSIVVDAVERHLRPRLAHVSKEVLELLPTLTNTDAAPPIAGEVPIIRIPATLPHPEPDVVNAGTTFAVRHIGLVESRSSSGAAASMLASARQDFVVSEVLTPNPFLDATIAANRKKIPIFGNADNGQHVRPSADFNNLSLNHDRALAQSWNGGNYPI